MERGLGRHSGAVGGIAMINCIGNLGGFVGPFMVGWIKDATGGFAGALCFLAVTTVASAVTELRTTPSRETAATGEVAARTLSGT